MNQPANWPSPSGNDPATSNEVDLGWELLSDRIAARSCDVSLGNWIDSGLARMERELVRFASRQSQTGSRRG
ncbi:MAG: hypothetical protein AAGD07_08325 [Planctomycetota bacterium]